MNKIEENQEFHRLTARYRVKGGWFCLCKCGGTKVVSSWNLLHGFVRSCGCLYKETRKTTGVANRRHWLRGTRGYVAWKRIHQVCYNPNSHKYHLYGARGIKMCERWLNSPEAFIEDMGQPPEGMSINRIDNDGDYEPGNCEWATPKQQANNTRANKIIEYAGCKMNLTQWADWIGFKPDTLGMRLLTGWTVEEAMTIPLGVKRAKKKATT